MVNVKNACKRERRKTCDDKNTLIDRVNELYCTPEIIRVTLTNIGIDKQLFIRKACCPNLNKLMVKVAIERPTVITDSKELITLWSCGCEKKICKV